MQDEIAVSVLCTAYNHKKYIRNALEGFVTQRSNFKYEVLINDDASTDGTADIIREYERKYPHVIKPVYQKENQYSQGRGVTRNVLLPLAKGRYVALCEGDDFWIDPLKLQKQFDYMESHTDCTFCFTNGLVGNLVKNIEPQVMVPYPRSKKTSKLLQLKDFNFDQVIKLGFLPTASFFFRRQDYAAIPSLSKRAFQGDQYIKLYLTSLGYAHFIDDQTCFYSTDVDGSATSQWKKNLEGQKRFVKSFIFLYEELDQITSHRYSKTLSYEILRFRFRLAMLDNDLQELRSSKYRKVIKEKGLFFTIKFYCRYFLPFGNTAVEYLKRMKSVLRNSSKRIDAK